MGRDWRDSSRGFTTAFWAVLSLSGKRHRRETLRQGYTTTTAYTRNHWNSFILSLFTAQCTSVASRVHMCAVSDWCVCSRFKKEWLRRPSYRRTLPLACSSAGTWTRRVYLTSQVRMPWGVLLCEQKVFPPALSSAQLLPFSTSVPSVLPSSLSPTVSPSVFFSFSWLSGSEPGFVQQPALSEEHSSTKRGKRQEHLSANSRLKGSPNSSETRTDRQFLASEVGETLASNLQRVIDTTDTNLECWNDGLFV